MYACARRDLPTELNMLFLVHSAEFLFKPSPTFGSRVPRINATLKRSAYQRKRLAITLTSSCTHKGHTYPAEPPAEPPPVTPEPSSAMMRGANNAHAVPGEQENLLPESVISDPIARSPNASLNQECSWLHVLTQTPAEMPRISLRQVSEGSCPECVGREVEIACGVHAETRSLA